MTTKRVLSVSVGLNLAALTGLAYFLVIGGKVSFPPPPRLAPMQTANDATGPSKSLSTLPEPPAQSELKPFHWSQIESPDYRVYVANLRSIGCPELTIRDIVSADVDNLYSEKRQELHLSGAETGPWSRLQQAQFVASLLGSQPDFGSSILQPAELAAKPKRLPPPSMPLVFHNVDLEKLHLNDGQREAIMQLQQEFVAQLGGSDGDPSDPGYRERWQQAQPEIDEMLSGMIGVSAYQDYQLEAAGNSQNDQAGTP